MSQTVDTLAAVFGFQTGGVRPAYDRPDVYDPTGTKKNVIELQKLYYEIMEALRTGNTAKFMEPEFQARLNEAMIPIKGQQASGSERILQNASRMGLDPSTTARLMADLDRSTGSSVAAAGRENVASRGNMILNLLAQIPGFTSNQQAMYTSEKHYENNWDAARESERDARNQANAATIRKYASFAFGGMGIDPMSMGGGMGGGMGLNKAPSGSVSSGYDPITDSYRPMDYGMTT